MVEEETLERRALLCRSAKELIDLIHGELDEGSEYVYRGTPERHRWDKTIDIEADEKRINSSIFREYGKNPNPNNSDGEDVCPSCGVSLGTNHGSDSSKDRGIEFDDKYRPIHIEREIIDNARRHFPHLTSNTEILTDIRHFGGFTTLIDFSRDLMVALFFACHEGHEEPNRHGQLIVLATDKIKRANHAYFSDHLSKTYDIPKIKDAEKDQKIPLLPSTSDDLPKGIGLLEPAKTLASGARVIAQKSVFVHAPEGFIPPDSCKIIPINVKLKPELLEHLRQRHHINQSTIYNDLHGFIGIQDSFAEARLAIYEAEKHMKNEEYDDAIDKYTKAIKLKPDSAEAYVGRGIAQIDVKQPYKSIADFDKAISLKSDYTRAYLMRGTVNFTTSLYDKAIEDFTDAIYLEPKYPLPYVMRGMAHSMIGDHASAQEDYIEAQKLGAKLPDKLNHFLQKNTP